MIGIRVSNAATLLAAKIAETNLEEAEEKNGCKGTIRLGQLGVLEGDSRCGEGTGVLGQGGVGKVDTVGGDSISQRRHRNGVECVSEGAVPSLGLEERHDIVQEAAVAGPVVTLARDEHEVGEEEARGYLFGWKVQGGHDGWVGGRDLAAAEGGRQRVPRRRGRRRIGLLLAELLGQRLAVRLLGPPLGGLGLVTEDEVELVLVAGTLPARLCTLVTCGLCLVALGRRVSVSRSSRP
jgi:hypothetical protein